MARYHCKQLSEYVHSCCIEWACGCTVWLRKVRKSFVFRCATRALYSLTDCSDELPIASAYRCILSLSKEFERQCTDWQIARCEHTTNFNLDSIAEQSTRLSDEPIEISDEIAQQLTQTAPITEILGFSLDEFLQRPEAVAYFGTHMERRRMPK